MCDDHSQKQANVWIEKKGLTRRRFTEASAAAFVALGLGASGCARKADITILDNDVLISTPDGMADAYFVRPDKPSAAVIIWPDIMGLRPSFRAMAERLAGDGYAALVVNPYYRSQKGRIMPEGKSFGDEGVWDILRPLYESLSAETALRDGRAFSAWLDKQDTVDTKRGMGTTGYCMSGSYTLRLAADQPQRIKAAGSFHGGQLVSDAPDSPHLLADKITGGVLIAIAENDDSKQPEAKTKLRSAFEGAGVDAEIEVYKDAMHGWCPPDSPVYNEAQAERAWSRMLAMFEKHLV